MNAILIAVITVVVAVLLWLYLGGSRAKKINDKLLKLLDQYKFLKQDNHYLRHYVDEIQNALSKPAKSSVFNAKDLLTTLERQIFQEKKMVEAAFNSFDSDKSKHISRKELDYVMDYLGFPTDADDVDQMYDLIDRNGDNKITYEEFFEAVGRMGGSAALFAKRREQIEGRTNFKESNLDDNFRRGQLNACGIDEHAQTVWSTVTSGSELDSAALLEPCQKNAVRHIRAIAQVNHEKALPELIKRVKSLGFVEKHLHMVLAWVRELSPIIVHVDLDKVGRFLNTDSHYRNQFETKTSGGYLGESTRKTWERDLFGSAYDTAAPFDRPKYGVQNVWNDERGVVKAAQYGDSYIVLKDVRLRCTLTSEDSANLHADRLAVLDFYAHVLNEYDNHELREILDLTQGGAEKIGDSGIDSNWCYKEAQIHGPINLDKHVDRLVVAMRHKGKPLEAEIKETCARHMWKFTWMDDMQQELEKRLNEPEFSNQQWTGFVSRLRGGSARS